MFGLIISVLLVCLCSFELMTSSENVGVFWVTLLTINAMTVGINMFICAEGGNH